MRITDLLDARSILLNASPKSKNEALDQIVDLMVKSEKINDKEAYRKQVYAREEESTTGIGEGIAIPHGKCDAVTKPGLAAMVVKDGVDIDSLDGEPVTLVFLIAAPNTEDNIHLDVLSKLSVLLMNEEFTEALRNAETVEEFMGIINDADEKEAGIDDIGLCTDEKIHTTLAMVHTYPDGDRDFFFYRNPGADMMLNKTEISEDILKETEMLNFANVVASIITTRKGALRVMPEQEEIQQYLNTIRNANK